MVSDAPAKKDAASDPLAEPLPATAKGGRLRFGLVLVGFFTSGFLASWYWQHSQEEHEAPAEHSDSKHEKARTITKVTEPAEAVPEEKADLPRGDALFCQGRYDRALLVYQSQTEGAKDTPPDALRFRIGLCLEGQGKAAKALAIFRTLTGGYEGTVAILAQLSLARLHLERGEYEAAAHLLQSFLLRADRFSADSPALAEARYMLALASSWNVLPRTTPSPLRDDLAKPVLTDWALPRYLDWLALAPFSQSAPLGKGQAGGTKEILTVQRSTEKSEAVVLQASVPVLPLIELLNRLAHSDNLQLQYSAQARPILESQSGRLELSHRPLREVILALAEIHDLCCLFKGGTVEISTSAEKPNDLRCAFRVSAAEAALRDAIVHHPGHLWTPLAYLLAGNLDAVGKRSLEAQAWFERILKETPRSRWTVEANYNRGLLLLQQGKGDEGRKALFRVVDQSPSHELAPLAYVRIGRMLLEQGELARAISILRRAEAFAAGTESHPVALLTLAAAQVATDNPLPANALLEKQRSLVSKDPFRQTAAFLSAYAHYRDAFLHRHLRREAEELLTALLGMREETALGPFGKVLLGRAYAALNMWDHAVRTYENALPQVQGPLMQDITLALGEALVKDKRPADAIRHFTALADGGGKWAPQAQLGLATIDLQELRFAECLNRCQKLLEDSNLDRKTVLATMGKAFEGMGEYRRAARCFAGQPPD